MNFLIKYVFTCQIFIVIFNCIKLTYRTLLIKLGTNIISWKEYIPKRRRKNDTLHCFLKQHRILRTAERRFDAAAGADCQNAEAYRDSTDEGNPLHTDSCFRSLRRVL